MLHVLNPKLLAALLLLGVLMRVLMPWWQQRDDRDAKPKQIEDCEAVMALIVRYKKDHNEAFPRELADLEYLLPGRRNALENLSTIAALTERYVYFAPQPEKLRPDRLQLVSVLYQNGSYYKGARGRCIGMANGMAVWMPRSGVEQYLKHTGINSPNLD